MTVERFDHVQLAIPPGGEAEARRFYAEILGMTEVAKPETLSAAGCWFAAGTAHLHVGIDPDFRPATKAHPALIVSNLGALAERLRRDGFAADHDDRLPGYRRIFTSDPFGNRIELMEAAG